MIRKHTSVRLAAAAATVGSLCFIGVGTASATVVPPGDGGTASLQNAATGKCIDDSNYGLRDFVCQDQSGPYAGFQQFSIS